MWATLERTSGLAAPMGTWSANGAAGGGALTPYLRPTEKFTRILPCPHGFCHREVVQVGDDWVATCGAHPPQCDHQVVARQDCLVYELHVPRLASTICNAIQVTPSQPRQLGRAPAWCIGVTGLVWGAQLPVWLAIQGVSHPLETTIQRLFLAQSGSALLLVPGKERLGATGMATMDARQWGVLDLKVGLAVSSEGAVRARMPIRDMVALSGVRPALPSQLPPRMERRGKAWVLHFQGEETKVKGLKGMPHLVLLLQNPGRTFSVWELESGASGHAPKPAISSGENTLDDAGIGFLKKRYWDLEAQKEQAEEFRDLERVHALEEEMEGILAQLKTAHGLGGRPRKTNSEVERLRSTLSKAIRRAMDEIARGDAELGKHLNDFIQLGTSMVYAPDPMVRWEFS